MLNSKLEECGVVELTTNELEETNGGFLALLVTLAPAYAIQAGVVGMLAAGVVASFKSGYNDMRS
ncbi:class IIb bacteriocin, lactobin A/cerein 7B family [Ohtaekwangia koreensis]|uniref:Class IIb bacteriocin, lactobin A/cerein 7B family n=1 Tax=Ohtaekwangia koreensis TaxID=688867 RepID=A0A1T5IU30_9BACT|nr:class IIb bacteriocin, lactobin A/cerein 7B family [Ohtaekwangia koreensis]